MKRMTCWVTLAELILIIVLAIRCSTEVAGVGTTNGCTVTASASCVEGSAPPFSAVLLFDVNYTPYIDSGLGIITSADEQGRFRFKALSNGVLNVVILDESGRNAVLFDSLIVGNGGTRDTARSSFLSSTGTITGAVACPSTPQGEILVYCTGTDYYSLLSWPGDYLLPSVPEGAYRIQAAVLGPDSAGIQPSILLRSNTVSVIVAKGAVSRADTLTVQ
jgi:hypothetical protein